MVFVELSPFMVFRSLHWSDEDFRALQNWLIADPEAGVVIKGSGGLRKLRWATKGQGKRGGARVIYYWKTEADHIYLLHGYAKNKQEDLTPAQIHILAKLMEDLENGSTAF